jgi:hypothetical protein
MERITIKRLSDIITDLIDGNSDLKAEIIFKHNDREIFLRDVTLREPRTSDEKTMFIFKRAK